MSAKYNRIGKNYNQTRKADPYLASRMEHHLQPEPGKRYLDIGCGTGNYTSVLAQLGGQFIGVDPSERMLEMAKEKEVTIDWLIGTAESLEVPAESVDGILASLTLHHWDSLPNGFRHLYAALKTDGRMVIFTSTPDQMEGYWLNHYFPQMMKDSMTQMPSRKEVVDALEEVGFYVISEESYEVKPDLQDGFLYVGKHDPSRYLDPSLRKGISSFSALAHQEEVENGLEKLHHDIQSGEIEQVKSAFMHDKGDYLFIIAAKP
ncbi:MAG: methyltransferase domain-containing protein [Bacteroidota bacterium]